ncbi:MAG: tetratricopeptide repeat protein, partial [Gammaproteobacteria bacterium]
MKIIILFIFILFSNTTIAKQEKIQDAFATFFSHLGDNLCRLKAYEIALNKYGNSPAEKIKAWEYYEEQCSRDGSYQLILGDFYLSYGFTSKAKKILEDTLKNANYDTRYHKLWLQGVYLGLNEMKKAKSLAEQMIKDYSNWFGGFYSLGAYYFNLEKYDLAKHYLDKAVTLNNKDPDTYLMLSYIAYVLNDSNEKVIKYYCKAINLDYIKSLLNIKSSLGTVVILVNQGKFEYAKNLLDEFQKVQQKFDHEVCKDERFLKAKKYYEDKLKAQATPDYPYVNEICQEKIGEILSQQISVKKQIGKWVKYKRQCSIDGSYQFILGNMYISDGNFEKARQILENAISRSSYDLRHLKLSLNGAYIALNEYEKAVNLGKKIINDYPEWYGGYATLGIDYFSLEEYELAKHYLEKAVALDNKNFIVCLILASTYYEINDKDNKVIEYYKKAEKLNRTKTLLDRRGCASTAVV